MASKFGKREKIVTGAILGIAAIAGVHLLVFQTRTQSFAELQREREAKQQEAEQYANVQMSDPSVIEAFNEQTAQIEEALWKSVLEMDLILPAYFAAEPEPDKPEEETPEAMAQYSRTMADWHERTDRYQIAVNTVLTERFERLIRMHRAYRSGQRWVGDNPRQGDPGTNELKMTFIGAGIPDSSGIPQGGWNLPIELNEEMRRGANLWDEVARLYERWEVLNLMPVGSSDYPQAEADYIAQLYRMGLDRDLFPAIHEDVNQFLPEYIKYLHARMIWAQRQPGQTIRVGRQELTFDLLMRMYDVNLPKFYEIELINLNRQLQALERIIPLARRNLIEEIQLVQIPKSRPLAIFDRPSVEKAKSPPEVEVTPERRSLLPASGITGQGAVMRQQAPAAAARPNVGPSGQAGISCLISMRLVATNDNLMRFLFDVTRDPLYILINNLTVYGQPNQKVMADVTFDLAVGLFGVSLPGEMIGHDGTPVSETGKRILAEFEEANQDNPLAMTALLNQAMEDAGLPPDAWRKAPEPAATPVATPPPAAPGGVPGMPPGMPPGMSPEMMMMMMGGRPPQ